MATGPHKGGGVWARPSQGIFSCVLEVCGAAGQLGQLVSRSEGQLVSPRSASAGLAIMTMPLTLRIPVTRAIVARRAKFIAGNPSTIHESEVILLGSPSEREPCWLNPREH